MYFISLSLSFISLVLLAPVLVVLLYIYCLKYYFKILILCSAGTIC